jgi:hypothetical protein
MSFQGNPGEAYKLKRLFSIALGILKAVSSKIDNRFPTFQQSVNDLEQSTQEFSDNDIQKDIEVEYNRVKGEIDSMDFDLDRINRIPK